MKKSYTFMTSLLTFYIRGKIDIDDSSVNLVVPNTFLTFIPLGKRSYKKYINHITSVNTSFSLNAKSFFFQLLVTFFGLDVIRNSAAIGIILALLGIMGVISSITYRLVVNDSSGSAIWVRALIFDKQAIINAGADIDRLLTQHVDDTNNAKAADKIVDAINKK